MTTYLQLLPVDVLNQLKPYLAKERSKNLKQIVKSILKPKLSYITYIIRGSSLVLSILYISIPVRLVININEDYASTIATILLSMIVIPGVATVSEFLIFELNKENDNRLQKKLNKLDKYIKDN